MLFQREALEFRNDAIPASTKIRGMYYVTAAVDPASLATLTSGETSVTINGVEAGDMVIANVPASLETGLIFSGVRVSATNTVAVRLSNMTAGAVDGASRTWSFLVIDLT